MKEQNNLRQQVQTTLRHNEPDRVPFSWGLHPTPEMTEVMDRYLREQGMSWRGLFLATESSIRITPRYIGPELQANKDMWGIVRKKIHYGSGSYDEIEFYPLAGASTESMAFYPWPNPEWFDYSSLRQDVQALDPFNRLAGKLWIDVCGNPLEIYTWMTGHEETFSNLVLQPDVVRAGLEYITSFFEEKIRRTLPYVHDRVDICYFADDLGGQNGLLMSRRTYRQVIMPFHIRLFRLVKELVPQASVMLHSDGSVYDLLPDLIEAGVDVLEAVQVDASKMEPERLKSGFGDRIAFHGGISVQALLPSAEPDRVESECKHLVEVFGKEGGYIAAPTHCIQVGTPPSNVLAMLRGVFGEAGYIKILDASRNMQFNKIITTEKQHLFFPVKNGAEKVIFRIFLGEKIVREFSIELAVSEAPDWWAYYDVSQFLGKQLSIQTLEASLPQASLVWLDWAIEQGDGIKGADDLYQERLRPQIHFTPQRGWNNDPNGLVFYEGVWHLFFQYNPFGIEWGNMHWGHATSSDLVRWEEKPIALYQKSLDDMAFSGGAVIDWENTSGFGVNGVIPMVLCFTSTGRGECLAFSLDGGESFNEYVGNPVIQHQGRDPKVIWYAPGKKWVMIVYEEVGDERGYAIYHSPDLINWQRTDFLMGYYECPELFEMQVENNSDERIWLIYGCVWEGERSAFLAGTFNGEKFTILDGPHGAHAGPNFYAAQIFTNAPNDRKIMIGWLVGTRYPGMPFSQGMSLPLELSFKRFQGDLRLCFNPIRELESLRELEWFAEDTTLDKANELLADINGDILDICLSLGEDSTGTIQFFVDNEVIQIDSSTGEVQFAGSKAMIPVGEKLLEIRVMVDRSVLEVFIQNGIAVFASNGIFMSGNRKLHLAGVKTIKTIRAFRLKSIWNDGK